MKVLVTAADSCEAFLQKQVNRLQMVQHNSLIGEVQPVCVILQLTFKLDGLAVVVGKTHRDGAFHGVKQFSEGG